jgi:hypothetical protein
MIRTIIAKKPAKLQWLQDPCQINGDIQNNIRRETSRHFRNMKRKYLKDKIDELARNSKNKNTGDQYRGINDFKMGYQPRSNLQVKDENGDLLPDSHNILNRWKNYSQLLNVNRVSDIKQMKIDMTEPSAPNFSRFEPETAAAKLKRYKSPSTERILAEVIQGKGEILRSDIHKLINFIQSKEKLPDQWKGSVIVPVH